LISFKHNNVFLATIKTIIRVLKCNPIFDSGFDYPVMHYKQKNILNIYKRNKEIKFFLVPINEKKNKFYIIKKL
jgi:putative component of membrane protein insertase Oxa1/YidC/SpoIIIJ protein YidD